MFKSKTYTVSEIYLSIHESLYPVWSEESKSLIKYLLREVLNIGFTDIVAQKSIDISEDKALSLNEVVSRLMKMEPIQYILGYAYFLDRKYIVNDQVLIPRPETEELVKWILEKNKKENPEILDVGIGTGCIGISLAIETGVYSFTGLDYNQAILDVATRNASAFGVQLQTHKVDILRDKIPRIGFDILVSNPPYVLPSEKKFMRNNVLKYEPVRALFVPQDDPLVYYRHISKYAAGALNRKGLLFFEINESFGHHVKRLMQDLAFSDLEIRKDIHGKDRFVSGRWL